MKAAFKSLIWYKNRLAAMSGAEILFRLREAIRRKTDRLRASSLIAPPGDDGTLPEIPGLCAGIDAWDVPDQLLGQWAAGAARAHSGRHIFFGQSWPEMPPEKRGDLWHLDPVTGTTWPRDVFCFAIDYRHAPSGDIKYAWELNRLQYLQPIAALARKRNDAALARFCLGEIEDWIDRNPPFFGINWNSGIELALRVVSIMVVTTLVGDHAPGHLRGKIAATLQTHGRWIARYPSRYSSANNHRAAEGLGLLMLGALCPHFPEAAGWQTTGWDILRDAARRLILPDGAGAEQAVAYAASTLETLLAGYQIAQSRGIAIPDDYLRRITAGGDYLRWLCDAGGDTPHIGDDDNACVFGAYHDGDRYAASIAGCVAAVTRRADLTPPGLRPHLRQALFGMPPAPDVAPTGARCFVHGGMTVGRHKTAQGEVMLAFDHGDLGYLSIAAHGHADALAVWLHVGDQPVFVDAGTYLYHAPGDDRRCFRSSAAHNTMTVAGQDSSLMSGSFNWSRKARATLRAFESRGDFWQAEAEHNGYLETCHALHRRSLYVSPASGAVIEDTLIAATALPVEISFLLHPDLTARREGHEILMMKGEHLLLRLRHDSALETAIGRGWYSPAFGIKTAAPRLSFSGILQPDHKAVTHLYWAF